MNFVALLLAAAATTAQLGSLRDSSVVVTGVDEGAFLASSNNVVGAGRTNVLFTSGGTVKALNVGILVEGGSLVLSGGTALSAGGAVLFPTNAMPDSGAAGWESLDQRMARRLYGAFYYDVDSDGNPTAVTLGSRYLPATYGVGPYSFASGGAAASGVGSFAMGAQSRATADGALAQGGSSLASRPGAVAMGSHAEATNDYSFVWQGHRGGVAPFGEGAYGSHGDGTYNIYPFGGVDGFWIGPQTLAQYVTSRISSFVDPSQPFTFRSALGDSGIQFSASGGHNREVFTSGTELVVQGGAAVSVASNATLAVARAADVTIGGTGLETWVSETAGRASDDSLKALVDSETGGTNAVKGAAGIAYLNATKWTGEGLASGEFRYSAFLNAWTNGDQRVEWTGSGWLYTSNSVSGGATGELRAGRLVFSVLSTADADFALVRSSDPPRDGYLTVGDTNALAGAIGPLLDIDGTPSNMVVYADGALKTKDGGAVDVQGMDYEALTNAVNEVKAKFWDEPLEVEWTFVAANGEFMMVATTNVNTGVLSP